jgi:hypothetical protein
LGFSSYCLRSSFLVIKGFKVHTWLSWVFRSSEGVWAYYSWSLRAPRRSWCFGDSWWARRDCGSLKKAWCTQFEIHRSGDGERVLIVSTWVLVTWGGAILLVSAPTWIRRKRQLLDTTGKKSVISCPSLSLLSCIYFHHLISALKFPCLCSL